MQMEPHSNFVITETDQSKHKCTAMLLNLLQITRKLSIGQCVTSPIFEMECAKIGHSRWKLIVFPAGQYEFERDNGQLSVYLRMMECEYENEELLVDVMFFIDSEEKFSKIVKASTFQYRNKRTRWVGTNLTGKLAFHTNDHNLMRDNDLVIGCRIIHSTLLNDEANNVEEKQKQGLTLEQKDGDSVGVVALPPSSIVQSKITDSTVPSVISTFNGVPVPFRIILFDRTLIFKLWIIRGEPIDDFRTNDNILNRSHSLRKQQSTAEVQENTPHILLLTRNSCSSFTQVNS